MANENVLQYTVYPRTFQELKQLVTGSDGEENLSQILQQGDSFATFKEADVRVRELFNYVGLTCTIALNHTLKKRFKIAGYKGSKTYVVEVSKAKKYKNRWTVNKLDFPSSQTASQMTIKLPTKRSYLAYTLRLLVPIFLPKIWADSNYNSKQMKEDLTAYINPAPYGLPAETHPISNSLVTRLQKECKVAVAGGSKQELLARFRCCI